MRLKELEAELEATRQKISEQLSMVGRSVQSIDPTLYDKEQELERLLKHLQAVSGAPTQSQKVLLVNEFENKREHWNANKAEQEEDQPMSINKWRGILQELAQRCPPDRWADDHQEGPSPDTFECGYCCALMQLHAMAGLEGHCIPIDEFPMPMRAIPKQQGEDGTD